MLISATGLPDDYTFTSNLYSEILYLLNDNVEDQSGHVKVNALLNLKHIKEFLASSETNQAVVYEEMLLNAHNHQSSLKELMQLKAEFPKQIRCRLTTTLQNQWRDIKNQKMTKLDPMTPGFWINAFWSDVTNPQKT